MCFRVLLDLLWSSGRSLHFATEDGHKFMVDKESFPTHLEFSQKPMTREQVKCNGCCWLTDIAP